MLWSFILANKSSKVTATVFPNPNNGSFSLKISGELEIEHLYVLSLNGKIKKELFVQKGQKIVNFNDYTPGVYILEVKFSNGEKQVSKVVVTK